MPNAAAANSFSSIPAVAGARAAMRTDPGRVRSENQDVCAAAPEHGVYVVCDGMGGAAAGELASQLAAGAFLHSIGQSARTPAEPGQNGSVNPAVLSADHPQTRLEQAVRAANLAVFQRAQKTRSLRGMGTTLVAALLPLFGLGTADIQISYGVILLLTVLLASGVVEQMIRNIKEVITTWQRS